MAATAAKKMVFEFTIDDDELNDEGTTDQATNCNFYKINLPASASILSKQIAKSQAKRAKKEKGSSRRRVDLSTVREQDESKNSENSSPLPAPEEAPSVAPSEGRSRIDSAAPEIKLKRQNSFTPSETSERRAEPMDAEEAGLLAMLLSGIEQNNLKNLPPLPMHPQPSVTPSPGLPKMGPGAKVSEWLLERSASPDNVSVVSSVMLEDSGMMMSYGDDEDDVFFDAPEDVVSVDMQGLSLNRNLASMTQSLVRVEEEFTATDGGNAEVRSGRSTSVSPRPTNEQFSRNSNGSATFNVKHSSTLARLQKAQQLNGNNTTPLSSRTTRSVLRVHNVNSVKPPVQQAVAMSKSTAPGFGTISPIGVGVRKPDGPVHSTPLPAKPNPPPPQVTINPSTPSRPASVASSAGRQMQNLEGLQDLIQMQEDALRRAALDGQSAERKMSWHSDQEANRQSTSTHSSLGSLCSSKSIDGAHALNKVGGTSKIPTPRSRLPTPRGSTLTKRVHSVAAAVRFTTSQPQHADTSDDCF